MTRIFADRAEAGRLLGAKLRPYAGKGVVVLGVPRGGVELASVVAADLRLPLDLILVKKITLPSMPETAIAAVGEKALVLDPSRLDRLGASWTYISSEAARLRGELARRGRLLRAGKKPLSLAGVEAVVIDDGAATGFTLAAAVAEAREQGARRVVAAVPIASMDAAILLRRGADELVVLEVPPEFSAVGSFYQDFSPVDDEEVRALIVGGRAAPT